MATTRDDRLRELRQKRAEYYKQLKAAKCGTRAARTHEYYWQRLYDQVLEQIEILSQGQLSLEAQ